MADDTLETLDVDISDLTIAEVVEIEERTGQPLDALGQDDKPKGKMLQALAYVVRRRENPDFTWEEAGALKITTSSEKVDPTEDDA
mgnify:CR=1 FL=1|tara:strand:- start:174 stop:431 length:258 start_codon:yes stop_codon:yes gene_type:complete